MFGMCVSYPIMAVFVLGLFAVLAGFGIYRGQKTGLWYTIASDVQIVRVDKNVILKWASIFTNSLPNGAGVSDNPPVFYVFILTSDKMFQSRPQKTQRIPRRIPDPAWTAGAPCGKSPRERA